MKNKNIDKIILALIVLAGTILRFWQLDVKPLWVDEALFANWVMSDGLVMQEFIPVIIAKIFSLHSETALRFMFALAGSFTIYFSYNVLKNKNLFMPLLVAMFPLFIFWSRMARPYAVAGLFVVLGWRYVWFYVPAIFTHPVALCGVKIFNKKITLFFLALLAVAVYLVRPDSADNFFAQIEYSRRFLYIPALVALLYFFDHFIPWLKKVLPDVKHKGKLITNKKREDLLTAFSVIAVILLTFFIIELPRVYNEKDRAWFRQEVRFADWRNVGPVEYSTNVPVTEYYSGQSSKYIRSQNIKEMQDRIFSGDTITWGVDYYAYFDVSKQFFPREFFSYKTMNILWNEGVIRIKCFNKDSVTYWVEY